jgi:hypothetical protein
LPALGLSHAWPSCACVMPRCCLRCTALRRLRHLAHLSASLRRRRRRHRLPSLLSQLRYGSNPLRENSREKIRGSASRRRYPRSVLAVPAVVTLRARGRRASARRGRPRSRWCASLAARMRLLCRRTWVRQYSGCTRGGLTARRSGRILRPPRYKLRCSRLSSRRLEWMRPAALLVPAGPHTGQMQPLHLPRRRRRMRVLLQITPSHARARGRYWAGVRVMRDGDTRRRSKRLRTRRRRVTRDGCARPSQRESLPAQRDFCRLKRRELSCIGVADVLLT